MRREVETADSEEASLRKNCLSACGADGTINGTARVTGEIRFDPEPVGFDAMLVSCPVYFWHRGALPIPLNRRNSNSLSSR